MKIQTLHEDIIWPSYAHDGDSGMDVFSPKSYVIPAGKRMLIPCGFKLEIPYGYEIQVRPKSGLALKHGITVLNTPGTIDSNYRGEVCVILINTGDADYEIQKDSKMAQIVLTPVAYVPELTEGVVESAETTRGCGGFGSTGV
jgi:dUTP pyrophosphatase